MKELLDGLQAAQSVVWIVLAVATTWRWARHPSAPSAWAAVTFVTVGLLVVVAEFVPDRIDGDAGTLWAVKGILAVLALFPYFLFRFATSLRPTSPTLDRLAIALTAAAGLSIFAFDELPDPGEERPTSLLLWSLLFLAQWATLSFLVAKWLWAAGRDRPTVIRRRMRTLSLAALGLVGAILLSVIAPDPGDDPGLAQVATALVVLATGPLFLVGLAPPRLLLAWWRRAEEAALYDAEAALMAATTTAEVADGLLPHVARTMGGVGATLVASDGTVIASHGSPRTPGSRWSGHEALSVPVHGGRLTIAADSYAPYFGRDEAGLLQRIARLTDVALRRAEVADVERTAAAELEVANAAMREFVAIASHDLRTPIAVIKGYAQLIAKMGESMSPEERSQHASTIARQADHLSTIVGDLLTVSRIDSGALEPDAQPVEVAALVDQVVADLGCAADVVVSIGDEVVLTADLDHAARILRNLIENARHHGEAPIDVTARRCDGHVEVRVRDHGDGIPKDFQPRLFQRFARSDEARGGRAAHGTGLGLSIVQGLARAGGGDAWFEPVSPGACFAFRLPAAAQEPT